MYKSLGGPKISSKKNRRAKKKHFWGEMSTFITIIFKINICSFKKSWRAKNGPRASRWQPLA
jgi:hypothetical protein